jgi:hypothetical protein
LSLGFYICYLIIFEVHSVNCSYVEDTYFQNTRQENSTLIDFANNNNYFKF